jgi:hypothetical protein
MLARPVLGLLGHLQRPLQASLRPPFQSPSSIRFANDLHRPNACRSSISQLGLPSAALLRLSIRVYP